MTTAVRESARPPTLSLRSFSVSEIQYVTKNGSLVSDRLFDGSRIVTIHSLWVASASWRDQDRDGRYSRARGLLGARGAFLTRPLKQDHLGDNADSIAHEVDHEVHVADEEARL